MQERFEERGGDPKRERPKKMVEIQGLKGGLVSENFLRL
jgi:hypothetical protein